MMMYVGVNEGVRKWFVNWHEYDAFVVRQDLFETFDWVFVDMESLNCMSEYLVEVPNQCLDAHNRDFWMHFVELLFSGDQVQSNGEISIGLQDFILLLFFFFFLLILFF